MAATAALLAGALLAGCGAPDFSTGGGRSSGLDSGFSSGYGSSGGYGASGMPGEKGGRQFGVANRGTYDRIEFSFELETQGNPFDYTENDVVMTIERPDQQKARVPAFFDGGKTWRVRYTPDVPGRYLVGKVTLNGREVQPSNLDKKDAEAAGTPKPGFVRRDQKDRGRFAFDNGNAYYPIGHNAAFGDGKSKDVAAVLGAMSQAGLNWSRIWMTHWDGKDLDWPATGKAEIGKLDLDAAKRWDEIVQAAEKDGVYFQLVLQHNGQYSTRADAKWDQNPLNKKNGGFLGTPDEFFTNPRAVALTKAKYRYIVARWGYSPSIMAWELFNEVQSTDAVAHKHADEVAAWHDGMASFLHQTDPYKHLITTSSDLSLTAIWRSMDYFQPHAFLDDPVATIAGSGARKLDRPLFFGEIGPEAGQGSAAPFVRRATWASLMSDCAGAAQFAPTEGTDTQQIYDVLKPAAEFVRASGLAGHRGLAPGAVSVSTEGRAPLAFSPGGGSEKGAGGEFTVTPSGTIDNIAQCPSFLHGAAHKELAAGATFKVDYAHEGTFAVEIAKAAKGGASVTVAVDGAVKATKPFAAADADKPVDAQIEVTVPAGSHTVRVQNSGADWVLVRRFVLAGYASSLGVVGKSSKDYAVAWLHNRADTGGAAPQPTSGKVTVAGLQAGTFRATWWDTSTGKAISEETANSTGREPLSLTTPPVVRDVALYVVRANEKASGPVVAAGPGVPPKRRK